MCEKKETAAGKSPEGTGPVASRVEPDSDANNFKVEHPERFPLVTAVEYVAAPELSVTGFVSPDVSRQVPVPSLASGRIIEINAQLGDQVKKGQLLFSVQSSDVSGALAGYRQAIKNEQLTKLQLDRAKILYEDGAIPKSGLEIAQNAEDDNLVFVQQTVEQLALLGINPTQPTPIVKVFAPVSGTISDQEITNQSAVQSYAAPAPFTISDLSHAWILCDVYENNLSQVHIGEFADTRLTGYPDRVLKARINNILPILDPTIRTAKVRLEVENPGFMHPGMFATATFHGMKKESYAALPSNAILHLHDREWVYAAKGDGSFQRLEVVTGRTLPGNAQEVLSGVRPGTRVLLNALDLQNTVSQ